MNIAYILDNNFIPPAAVSACSLCENNRAVPDIHFYVLSLGISPENLEKLEGMITSYETEGTSRSLSVIPLGSMEQYFDFSFTVEGWSSIVLARLLLDRFLPETVHRVLYLDGDTLGRGSLQELFCTDMGESSLAAAIEPTCSHKRKEALDLKGLPYYNAGVLLIDMDNWRAKNTGRRIIAYYRDRGGKLFANDQDAMNGCEKGNIRRISCGYNYHNTYDIYSYRLMEKNCDYDIPSREEMEEVKKNPTIVHFLGEERPWRAGNKNRFRKEYEACLAKTPWRDTPQEKGWEGYFFCWNLFNRIMRPFPMLRCRLINQMIPWMLKVRGKRAGGNRT